VCEQKKYDEPEVIIAQIEELDKELSIQKIIGISMGKKPGKDFFFSLTRHVLDLIYRISFNKQTKNFMLTKKIIFPIVVLCHILVLGCNKDQLEGTTLDVYENSIASVTRYVDSIVSASRRKGESQKNPGESILRYVDKSSMRVVQYLGKSFVLGDVLDDFGGKTKVNLEMSRKILFLPSSGGLTHKIIECYTSDISDMEIASYSAKESKGRNSAPNSEVLNQKMNVYNQNYLMMHGIGEVKRTIIGSSKSSRKGNITSVSDGSFNNSFNGSSDCQTWGTYLLERDWYTGEILSSTLLYTYTVGDCTRMNEDTAIPIQGGGSGSYGGSEEETKLSAEEILALYNLELQYDRPDNKVYAPSFVGSHPYSTRWHVLRAPSWNVMADTYITYQGTEMTSPNGRKDVMVDIKSHSTTSSYGGRTYIVSLSWTQTSAQEFIWNNGTTNAHLYSKVNGTLVEKIFGEFAAVLPFAKTDIPESNDVDIYF
jgi:hypothetical protein